MSDIMRDITGYPGRQEMFYFGEAWALEDFMSSHDVFINMNTGAPCHMDSYGTLVDFKALDVCLADIDEHYNPEKGEWQNVVNHFLGNPNMQPPLKLVAHTIVRRHDLEIPELDDRGWLKDGRWFKKKELKTTEST